jgi:hypothetical protein
MMPFEKRLARLEAARNMRFLGRKVSMIFDADEADIHADSHSFKRTREANETPEEFQHRVTVEASKFGSKLIIMTRQRFDEIAARIKEEV